jgi:uncharacterized protein (TIGR03437 family)
MSGRSLVAFAVVLLHYALQAQTVSFLAHRDFPIGAGCCTVASGDFNGDGKLDLLVFYGSGNLALLPGDGAGGFKPKIELGTPSGNLHGLAVADMNGDGKLDLVVGIGPQIFIFMGRGDGTFLAPSHAAASGDLLFVADLNGDHIPDLGVFGDPSCGGLEILLGNGDGTFQKPPDCIRPGEGMGPYTVVGDFDGDGKPDFAWASSRSNGSIHLFLGNGDGTFRAQPVLYVPTGVTIGLAVGDLNHDGKLDLVIHKIDHIVILFGKGDGSLGTYTSLDLPSREPAFANTLVVADFNGDGNPDIATHNVVIAGNGDGTLQPPQYFLAGSPSAILAATGDFNGDGFADLIFVDYSLVSSDVGQIASATTLSVLLSDSRNSPLLALGHSAATGVDSLAPASIGSIYGKKLAAVTATAAGPTLPTQLGGIRLRVRDGTDTVRLASLFYVSPSQINFLVPEQTAIGPITLQIDDGSTTLVETANATMVDSAAPGIFTANGQGQGVVAATAVRVQADGSLQPVAVFDCKGSGQCAAVPIDLAGGRPVYLSLYGTGFRSVQTLGEGPRPHANCTVGGTSAAIQFLGAQPTIPGLDQLNLLLPASLPSGTALVECQFLIRAAGFFAGYTNSNPVQIAIK